jgi:hypothetical protein
VFAGWNNFFFMVGSSGGGLIGLLFVVVTLTSGAERPQALHGARIYLTPTALHFAVVLTMSAVAIAPALPVVMSAGLFGVIAVVGLGYAIRSCVGMATAKGGTTHWSDFWMYGAGPAAIYLGLVAAATAIATRTPWAVHALAALLLILLITAIRNAWDLITWMAPKRSSDGGL